MQMDTMLNLVVQLGSRCAFIKECEHIQYDNLSKEEAMYCLWARNDVGGCTSFRAVGTVVSATENCTRDGGNLGNRASQMRHSQ